MLMANRKLHVGNISYRVRVKKGLDSVDVVYVLVFQVSSKDLRVFLSKYGPISSCSIVRDNKGLSKG